MNNELVHYGTPRHSGRYPWGSGENPYQHGGGDFRASVKELRDQGLTEVEIAKAFDMSTTQLRQEISLAKAQETAAKQAEARRLKDQGMSNVAIGKQMGINESSVRSLLNDTHVERNKITQNTVDILKKNVDEKDYIDIGTGTELMLGVSETRMKNAIRDLENQGYKVQYIKVEQMGTGKTTTIKVLAKGDIPYSEIYKNRDKIGLVEDHSEDGGRTFLGLKPIQSISSKRIEVCYAEDGGTSKDGVIELRRGVDGLDLGGAKYAQVRIGVDGTHYLKGMAMYADDLPKGVDIRFNTNKHKGTPMISSEGDSVLKKMKDDPDNPFGAVLKIEADPTQGRVFAQRGYLNIVNEEGDWGKWSKTLASQMLSKQPVKLAKDQLSLSKRIRKDEFDEIMSVTNPTVKRHLLEAYAEECDSAAVHLKAAAMPRQASHVILPINSLKENEIYAPNYRNGETVVLIRYPHGGRFEIPELKVNNGNKDAKRVMGNAMDAVGINHKVAARLSGADFDGDTVLVIPNNSRAIKTSAPLKGLKNFDPQAAYPGYPGMKVISSKSKQTEMGKVSNLITDMTIKGASSDEIARAVRHSMVVIDAEKHKLNYKQSYIDNGIAELKAKYQGTSNGRLKGASTLISRASSDMRVPQRKEWRLTKDSIDSEGRKIFTPTGETYTKTYYSKKTGEPISTKTKIKTTVSKQMLEYDDARILSSGTPIENVYADYANSMKAMANRCRKEALATKPIPYSPSARKKYQVEVDSLISKLTLAKKNAPYERKAQALANVIVSNKVKDNPFLKADKSEMKKLKGQALAEARARTNAKKMQVDISPKEWEAIQAGAVSPTKLKEILDHTDMDKVKQYATPRQQNGISSAKIASAKSMIARGYKWNEVADMLGVSTSTLQKYVEGE